MSKYFSVTVSLCCRALPSPPPARPRSSTSWPPTRARGSRCRTWRSGSGSAWRRCTRCSVPSPTPAYLVRHHTLRTYTLGPSVVARSAPPRSRRTPPSTSQDTARQPHPRRASRSPSPRSPVTTSSSWPAPATRRQRTVPVHVGQHVPFVPRSVQCSWRGATPSRGSPRPTTPTRSAPSSTPCATVASDRARSRRPKAPRPHARRPRLRPVRRPLPHGHGRRDRRRARHQRDYQLRDLDAARSYDVSMIAAPIFGPAGEVALAHAHAARLRRRPPGQGDRRLRRAPPRHRPRHLETNPRPRPSPAAAPAMTVRPRLRQRERVGDPCLETECTNVVVALRVDTLRTSASPPTRTGPLDATPTPPAPMRRTFDSPTKGDSVGFDQSGCHRQGERRFRSTLELQNIQPRNVHTSKHRLKVPFTS